MTLPGLKGVCIFDEQGSGKTVMALAAFDVLKHGEEVDQMIIVCPKSMMTEWPKDIGTFLNGKYRCALVEGDTEERRQRALDPVDILIVNYDAIPQLSVALQGAAGRCRTVLVVDESYYVKNPDAIRSGAVRDLRRRCVRSFVLCGTPAPNTAADVIHQFDVADDGFTFGGFRSSGDADRDKPKITEAIQSRGLYVRRLKSKVLPDLPEKSFVVVAVDLVGRQAELYQQAREELVLWLRTMDNQTFQRNLTDYFARRQILLQICSCPSEVDRMYTEEPAKLLALDELLERLVAREGRKVVLWSYYRKSIEDAAARYGKYGLVRIDGSTSRNDRTVAVSRFQGDPTIKIFLGNPAAAGAGITLHAAADAVYISYPSQAAHFLQSIDRIHRRGQTAPETYYHLFICRGTIEEGEVTRLRRKEIEQHDLLGDEIPWPSSIDNALAELVGGRH